MTTQNYAAPNLCRQEPAPLLRPNGGDIIPNKFIIKFKRNSSENAIQNITIGLPFKPEHIYNTTIFEGFAAQLSNITLARLRSSPIIDYIEHDAIVRISSYITQDDAAWGLGRLSDKSRGNYTYVYDSSAGEGTCAYVIDTGIYTTHSEFEGRASAVANFVDDSDDDENGHGTHVAAVIGGARFGVAKKTKLLAVKIVGTDGIGTQRQQLLPASAAGACVVGASTSLDAMSPFSSIGANINVFAPGTSILSAWVGGINANHLQRLMRLEYHFGDFHGLPHITGLGAYLLALHGKMTPAELCSYIASTVHKNILTGVPNGTINTLAFNGNPSA
ncbi:unnamed protein product [Parascedosporium putredinis]|uniref:Uncharacterized protein n=1 Tax=Parascedosporium putredinis TaxID=1442378 RepID=A0A9P1H093_9PEZI|nr:unnamed protein product [Parascedosporium putredinis]CAI7992555.1 unnamed protein product [Parascedosporium putredinis]